VEAAQTTQETPQEVTLDDAVEAAIAEHGDDPRAAVRALLEVNLGLEQRLAGAVYAVSYGFDRGWHHRKR
jgi:hypothetical protein